MYASVDSGAIEQVIVNLLSNAMKYMGKSEYRLRQVQFSLCSNSGRVTIRVADTGIGMSEHVLARIFDRFWRANDEEVRSVAGSGLGLTVVQHIVEGHTDRLR